MRLLQFTDTHLPGTPGGEVRGLDTGATLARCIAHAKRRHPDPEAVLLTGDLVHDDPGGYMRLRAQFASFPVPVHCLPGNHDEGAALRRELAGPPFVHEFAMRRGRWLFLMLDSTVPGEDHGHLSTEQLGRLDVALGQHADAYALICLHHHPVPHGCAWLDAVMLDNPGAFFDVLRRHAGVRALLWGHAHQQYEGTHERIRLMGTPSTCMQFAEQEAEPRVDDRPPAYRWLTLDDDGGMETGIEWVHDDE